MQNRFKKKNKKYCLIRTTTHTALLLKMFYICLCSFIINAHADLLFPIPQQASTAQKAVYKIQKKNHPAQSGTVFFTAPKVALTNFHVFTDLNLYNENFDNIEFYQEGRLSRLKIKKIIALSALNDTVLLETETSVEDYLNIDDTSPSEMSTDLFIAGYPYPFQTLQWMRKIGDIKRFSNYNFQFPGSTHSTIRVHGASGSPILNSQGQAVGILSGQIGNIYIAVNASQIKPFQGTFCANFKSLNKCIDHELSQVQQLAVQNHVIAQHQALSLVFRYYNSIISQNILEDITVDVDTFHSEISFFNKQAMEKGYIPAQLNHAISDFQNHKYPSAFDLFYKLADEENNMVAQYYTALMYWKGKGVLQNRDTAFYWMEQSAQQGYIPSQMKLSEFFQIRGDTEQAYIWKKTSASAGYRKAQYELALMYLQGNGVEQDEEKAFYWMNESANRGYKKAQQALKN